MHFDRRAHEVARRVRPALALPMVLVCPDRMPVGAVILSIDIEHGLGVVVAGRQVTHAPQGVTDGAGIERRRVAGLELIDVDGEERNASDAHTRRLVGRHAGLDIVLRVECHKNASGDRRAVQRRGEADLELRALSSTGTSTTAGEGCGHEQRDRAGTYGMKHFVNWCSPRLVSRQESLSALVRVEGGWGEGYPVPFHQDL